MEVCGEKIERIKWGKKRGENRERGTEEKKEIIIKKQDNGEQGESERIE